MSFKATLDRTDYQDVVVRRTDVPIYFQPWWLESVTWTGEWSGIVIREGETPVAVWPFIIKRKGLFRLITLPPLTPCLGPLIFYPEQQRHARRLSLETSVVRTALSAMPSHDAMVVATVPGFSNALPLQWEGFEVSVGYTYRVDLRQPTLLDRFEPNARNKVRKASRVVSVGTLEADEFYSLVRLTYERQSLNPSFSLLDFRRHDSVLAAVGRRRIFGARNRDGIHSGLYLTWDDECGYVHLVGEDPTLRKSGAGILLIHEAMLYARDTLHLAWFDFAGSSIESVERVRRDCAGQQTMILQFQRYNSLLARAGANLNPVVAAFRQRMLTGWLNR